MIAPDVQAPLALPGSFTPSPAVAAPRVADELSDEDLELVVGGLARARVVWEGDVARASAHSGM